MPVTPKEICRCCFFVVILVGVGFIAVGVFVVPVLPHFQLDVVLSPDELSDQQICDSTLALLKDASGNQWLMWTAGGIVLCAVGLIGSRAASRLPSGSSEGAVE